MYLQLMVPTNRVGIGSTNPTVTLDVGGVVVTATAFVGDGAGLTGVASTDNIINCSEQINVSGLVLYCVIIRW